MNEQSQWAACICYDGRVFADTPEALRGGERMASVCRSMMFACLWPCVIGWQSERSLQFWPIDAREIGAGFPQEPFDRLGVPISRATYDAMARHVLQSDLVGAMRARHLEVAGK